MLTAVFYGKKYNDKEVIISDVATIEGRLKIKNELDKINQFFVGSFHSEKD